ncbi:MAG: hypothetical protein ACP5IZ_05925 [Thermoprotei archaeon]
MNKNKRGKPYKYPNALIRTLYHLPYRETQGFIKALTALLHNSCVVLWSVLHVSPNLMILTDVV